MVETSLTEQTPLVRTGISQLRSRPSRSPTTGSAHGRTVDFLKKVQGRFSSASRGDVAAQGKSIEKVCKELEESERNSKRFFYVSIFFIVNHILGGAVALHYLEGWSFYDCIYFCIVTTTTVGYGDITPTNKISKIYVIYYVIVSIGLISALLAYLIGLLLDQQEEILISAIIGDHGEEQADADTSNADDNQMDRMEASTRTDQILEATKRLDMADYYGLGFSVFFLLTVLVIGFLVFLGMESLSVVDALYATIISATTVGFGDFEPTSNWTKVIMTVWLCFSTIAVAKVVADFTDANVKAKQRAVSRRLLTASMDVESLKMMDRNNDGSVDKCEFLAEQLIRLQKVERKEVDTILLRFQQLDKNNSGEITAGEAQGGLVT